MIYIVMICCTILLLHTARGLRGVSAPRSPGILKKLRGGAYPNAFATSARDTVLYAKKEILALDFDGVLCKSDGESSYSSIIAAREQWPEECTISYSFEFNRVRQYISQLRPIIETGYENMVLVRYILELLRVEGECDVDTGCTVDITPLLKEWCPELRDELIEKYNTDKKTLINMFGNVRDRIIEERYQFWVELNEIYPHVAECFSRGSVQDAGKELNYCIVTSKQGRFANSILNYFNIEPPRATRMFDLENPMGPKPKVLLSLLCGLDNQASPNEIEAAVNGETLGAMRERGEEVPLIHFVEDRYIALLQVLEQQHLKEHVKLYLVDYGYNTLEEREAAAAHPDIEVIDGAGLTRLMNKFIVDK
jgi:phosphoglycolate phosphatase-like HAD superfamily hydrolase